MTPLVKKILESGLVEKHAAALLERWGSLEPGSVDLVGKRQLTEKNLEQFVEEIDALISPDQPVHETRLEATSGRKVELTIRGKKYRGVVDEMERLILQDGVVLVRGEEIEIEGLGIWIVEDVAAIYVGDILTGYQLTVHAR